MFNKPILFLATSKPAESKEFYGSKIGLSFVSSDPYALVFSVAETELRIQIVDAVISTPYTSLGWSVDNLQSVVEKLRQEGVEFERYEGLEQDEFAIWPAPGGAKISWFKDPDDNIISLTQFSQ